MHIDLLKSNYGIGLTGGIATGKSTVANYLRECGYTVIDADVLARVVVEKDTPGLSKIAAAFGQTILNSDGTLNRTALAKKIYADKSCKTILESITHPLIHEALAKELEHAGLLQNPQFWFYEAALLFEVGKDKEFRQIWATFCDEKTQITRLQKRNSLSEDQAKAIIAAQLPAKEKRDKANFSINTALPFARTQQLIREKLNTAPFNEL